MFLNPERSFVATMQANHGNLHIPRLTYGGPTHIKRFYYEPFAFDSRIDVSNYLCVRKEPPPEPLKFYFHCFNETQYAIYIINKGPYYHHALSNEDKDFIGAFHVDDASTLYQLTNVKGGITTREHFDSETPTIRIKTLEDSILSVRGATTVGSLVCTSRISNYPVDFKLNIVSRGVYKSGR